MSQLERLQALILASQQLLTETLIDTSIDALLCRIVDAARSVTGARYGIAGYGLDAGRFRSAVLAPAGLGPQSCPADDARAAAAASLLVERFIAFPAAAVMQSDFAAQPAWSGPASALKSAELPALDGIPPLLPTGRASDTPVLGASLLGRDGRPGGLILVADPGGGEFRVEDELLLVQLASLAALALQRAEARTEVQESAAWLEAMATALPNSLLMYDAMGRVVGQNPAADKVLSRHGEEAAQALTEQSMQPAQAGQIAHMRAGLSSLLNSTGLRVLRGEVVENEIVAVGDPENALSLSLLVSGRPVRDQGGRLLGAVLSGTDITELAAFQARQRAEHEKMLAQAAELEAQADELHVQNEQLITIASELELERARLEAVLQQMPGGVIIADARSGRILLTNDQMGHILRGNIQLEDNLAAYSQYPALYPDGRPYSAEERPLQRTLRNGDVVTNEEMRIIRGDRSEGVILVSSRPVRDSRRRIVAAVVTMVDITERKQMEAALRQAHDELEVRVQARTADLLLANQALAYQASLLANINDALVATDSQMHITAWNRAAEEMLGWSREEVTGKPLDSLGSLTPIGTNWEHLASAMQERGRLEAEFVYQRRDGATLYLDTRVMTLLGAEGEITGYVAVCRNITARRQAEQERRTSEELLHQFAENANEVFWIADGERLNLLYVNQAYERIWQQSRRELYDRPQSFLKGVHPADRARIMDAIRGLREHGLDERFRLLRDDGDERWVQAHAFPIRDENGQLLRVAGLVEDITEQVLSFRLLEQRVSERTRELSTLLAVSHQMASVLRVKPLLARILDELINIVHYTSAAIYRLTDNGDEVQVLEYRGPAAREEVVDLCFPVAGTVGLEEVLARREPILIADTWGESDLARAWRASPHEVQRWLVGSARSWMAVPLRLEDRIIGILRLDHQEPNRFAARHAELAMAFADHAAVALENAELYEQVQALAALEERQRLARDLHDAVSQTLFSASLIADVLPRVWGQDRAQGEQSLNELQQLTRGALGEMRTLLFELRPAGLVDVEMGVLLRHLVDAASVHLGAPITLTVQAEKPIPPDVQLALYRIAQESLNNVVKHSQARTARVELCCTLVPATGEGEGEGQGENSELQVAMVIADNGQGFDLGDTPGGSFGLSNMEERAAAIGAALDVSSAPGRGTRVRVVWSGPPGEEKIPHS